MNQEEFKSVLDNNNISYQEHGKWLIIDDSNNNIKLNSHNLYKLTEFLIFNNKGNVDLSNNKLKELPKNIIFSKNVNKIILIFNYNLKLKYYCNYFSKTDLYYLNENLKFEKLINTYFNLTNIIKEFETPNICLTKVLNGDNKDDISINLPKSFLSISSWI